MAMAGDFAVHEVNHVLGNVRRVIGDPLDVPRGRVKMKRRFDVARIRLDQRLHVGDHLAIEFVDVVVPRQTSRATSTSSRTNASSASCTIEIADSAIFSSFAGIWKSG